MSTDAIKSASDVWNEILAPKFIRYREILVEGAIPHGERAMALFPPQLAERAIDIGCGFGDATLKLGERVGPVGAVTGLDVAHGFLEIARAALHASGAHQVSFVQGDAETFAMREAYDYLFARFGTMFFERPLSAFRNMHAMLRPGGQLVMTTWRTREENPWLSVAKAIAQAHLPPLGEQAVSCGPGPFSLSEPALVRDLLTRAGFREVSLVASDGLTRIGRTLDEAVAFQLALGPAGEIVREAGTLGERALPKLRDALATALARYLDDEGVFLPAAAWIVHAQR